MTATDKSEYDVQAGDRVQIRHIMYEDSCPEWVDGGTGTVVSVSGATYSPDVVVRLDDGREKTVTGTTSHVRPLA